MPVAVAPREMVPLAAAELEDRLDDTGATELDDLLDDTGATELDDLLDEATDGAELDRGTDEGAALDAGIDEGALDAPPQIATVNCALFLPTPATCANLSFTHWGVTGE